MTSEATSLRLAARAEIAEEKSVSLGIDPSASATSRRTEFLGCRAAAKLFYGSAESQPYFSNVPTSRIFFGAYSAQTYSVV